MSALDASRRTTRDLIPIVIAALLLRLPIALSRAPLGFDDGVYFASAGALRAGGRPFAEVYSSQGPAFLPLLWLADQLGLRTWWSPRLLPLLAGVALTALIYRLAQSLTDRAGAATSALLVATSGCLLYSTTRIESDGVALAFAAGAVLVASRSGAQRDVLTSVLVGIAVAVKSLLVAPAALAVLWLVWRRRGWRPAALVVAGAAVVLSLLSVPWGLRAVWEQSILLHLQAADGFDVAANSQFVRGVLRDRDLLLIGFGVAAIAWSAGLAIVGGRGSARAVVVPSSERDLRVAMWIWTLGSVAVVLLHQPLFLQHLAIVVPPAALLIGLHRPPVAVIVAVAALLLPSHGGGAGWRWTTTMPSDDERVAIDVLRRIEPQSGMVISDAPTLVWLAGRTSPASVVDVSFVRIEAGQLTTADVVLAAHERDVCGVLIWTQRLGLLPGLRQELRDYRSVVREGDQELWLREGCELGRVAR